ncbi:peroxiredoxin [Candidatus Dependentiae bacterium Noda2021]|nr:peroxiredoxin [Candidatus Dependentiae bacterium Noda2021]
MFYSIAIIILLVTIIKLTLNRVKPNVLTIGQTAPSFELHDETGTLQSLRAYKGKKVILYFYPKDNTPGCTSQACSLRDGYKDLQEHGFTILGVSFDSPESHRAFIQKNNLPFHLLSDSDKTVTKAYGALMIGNIAPQRKTFIINEKGIIDAILSDVDIKNHAEQILALSKKQHTS